MSLSSQSARPASRRSYMYRRSRRRSPRVAIGLALILVAGVVATAMAIRGGPDESAASTATTDADTPSGNRTAPPLASRAGDLGRDLPSNAASQPNAATLPTPPIDLRRAQPQDPETPSEPSDTPAVAASTEDDQRAPANDSRASTPPVDGDAPSPRVSSDARQRATMRMQTGMTQLSTNRLVDARRTLTAALDMNALASSDERLVRQTLHELNDTLVFGRDIVPDDPFARRYTVQSGDTLDRIVRREDVHVDWRFIQRINGIRDPRTIRVGQKIKLITGPFHAIVDKDAFRLDVYLGEGSQRIFVRSFPVGLGEYDSTPEGRFIVRPKGKVIDPPWTNPRTREHYRGGDPDNPIGDRWLALDGLDPEIRDLTSYGLHGTIEPDSIGKMESMGCIRLLPDDIHLVYEMLADGVSHVHVARNRRLMTSSLP